jgi:sugar lactone lactonase YvrE
MIVTFRRHASFLFAAVGALGIAAPSFAQQAVTLDAPVAASDEPLSAVSGLRELSDGSLLVADGLEGRLLHVAPDLDSATPMGREGAGPGEYRTPDALFALAGDSTLMVDLGNGRLATLAPDGSIVRTHPIAADDGPEMTIMLPGAVDRHGRVYFQRIGSPGGGGPPDSAAVARFDPATERTSDVARVKLPEMNMSSSGGANSRQEVTRPVPLSPQDAWTATPDGRLAIARQGSGVYWLELVGPTEAVRGADIPYEPLKVRGGDKEAWIASLSGALGVSVENENGRVRTSFSRGGRPEVDPDDFEWPGTKPAFPDGALRVAPDGRFWLERYVPAGAPRRFDVLDARGRRVGSVELPADRRLEGFGRNSVYLSRTDDLDFVWLERYPLPTL